MPLTTSQLSTKDIDEVSREEEVYEIVADEADIGAAAEYHDKIPRAIQPIDDRYRWNHSRLMHQDCWEAHLIECFKKNQALPQDFLKLRTPHPQLHVHVHAALGMAAMMCQ